MQKCKRIEYSSDYRDYYTCGDMHKVWGDNLQSGIIKLESSNNVNACGTNNVNACGRTGRVQ